MKRMILLLAAVLLLCGCGRKLPERDETGAPWGDELVNIGLKMGVSDPGFGLTFGEYNDVQAFSGIYYATWNWGEAETIVNAEGEEAVLYPCTVYLLIQDCDTEADAARTLAKWRMAGEGSYEMTETGQAGEMTLSALTTGEDNPYSGGMLAAGSHGKIAVSVELMYTEDFDKDPETVLRAFLDALRFRAEE